ncbi:hypothetical protein LTR95_007941 [Oleoguttula sp. CCFEE 5521]
MASLELGGFLPVDGLQPEVSTSSSSSGETIDKNTSTDDTEWVYPHPTNFKLPEASVDEIQKLRVAVIGAGLTGIIAGALLPAKVPGIDLHIFEKNSDVGGTWLENRYPGVRCDIPPLVYQSTFSPNTQWSEEYAQGAETLEYWKSVAKKHDVYSKVRFGSKVLGAYWEPDTAQWRLEIRDFASGELSIQHFDFLLTVIGHFNEWKLPDYPGIDRYKGMLMHSSGWDPAFDPRDKRIATIGNGASGIQVTTEIRKVAAHVDHYARSKTWIAGAFQAGATDRKDSPIPISQEERNSFEDPVVYLEYRKKKEGSFWRAFGAQLADSESSKAARENFIELMRKRSVVDPSLIDKLIPDFPPHCRPLITQLNLTFIQTPIKEFTEEGIITVDGVHRPVDAVIASTGANTHFAPPFPIVAGDTDLARDWKYDGAFGFPSTYP